MLLTRWVFLVILLLSSTTLVSYPMYQEFPTEGIRGEGTYGYYIQRLKKNEVHSILEIGSRDAKDAVHLSNHFKCHVFAFECNPPALEICARTIGSNPNVTLVPLACWDKSGSLPFYQVKERNIGASSCFRFNAEAKNYPDIIQEGLTQEEITVEAIRLDEFLHEHQIDHVDLICMDAQGAAFQVLVGLGTYLSKVKYIITELEVHPIYHGEILYGDVEAFLTARGFKRISAPLPSDGLFGDVLYVNIALIKKQNR